MKNKIYILTVILLIFCFLFKENIYAFLAHKTVEKFVLVDNVYENKLKKDYEDSLTILGLKDLNSYEYIYSKVLYNNLYAKTSTLTIYYGSDHNLKEGMAVINNDGLIGTIKKVNKEESIVQLLPNNDLNLSVKVNDYYGILSYESNRLIIKNIEVEKNVNIQDVVYTSGLGKIVENIPIGVIKNIEKTNYGNVAEVSLFVNLNNVNFVAILKDVLWFIYY